MDPPIRAWRRFLLLALTSLAAGLVWSGRHQRLDDGRIFRIVGGSMAPTLTGTSHYAVLCADCGFPFACDAQPRPFSGLAVCPNCRYAENSLSGQVQQGEQVGIDRAALMVRAPKRWEVVALQSPEDESKLNVKRIVGLPGEHLALEEGDVFANGHPLRKSLPELRQVAVPVHDDRFRPTKTVGLPARWQGEHADTLWRTTKEGYLCDAATVAAPSAGEADWLTYRHWHGTAYSLPRTRESPVFDDDAYNQAVLRELQNVRDLYLSCRVQTHGDGSLMLRIHDGRGWFHVELWPEQGKVVLRGEDEQLAVGRFPRRLFATGAQVEFALCDWQVLLSVDNVTVLSFPYRRPAQRPQPATHPLGISCRGLAVRVSEMRVLRDIHYLAPVIPGRAWTDERTLAANEYFVLGDNAPISIDSRHWAVGSVRRTTLVGVVRSEHSP